MSYWIELHCDGLKDGRDPNNILRPFCYTHENNNVMEGGGNSIVSRDRTFARIKEEARNRGWIKYKGKWFCPNCAKHKKELADER